MSWSRRPIGRHRRPDHASDVPNRMLVLEIMTQRILSLLSVSRLPIGDSEALDILTDMWLRVLAGGQGQEAARLLPPFGRRYDQRDGGPEGGRSGADRDQDAVSGQRRQRYAAEADGEGGEDRPAERAGQRASGRAGKGVEAVGGGQRRTRHPPQAEPRRPGSRRRPAGSRSAPGA